jgi:polyisoprenoid-binding protein YceI
MLLKSALIVALLLPPSVCATDAAAGTHPLDTKKSVITVHVFKAGFFSAFGHNHEVRAPISAGSIGRGSSPSVELTIDTRKMLVVDADVSDKDRADIQSTMLGPKVLDVARYPEIRFRSRRVEQTRTGQWRISGELTLHGQTRPLTLEVSGSAGRYRGSSTLRQKDFGITPVTVAGGTVKVKDEVRVDFDVLGTP